MLYVGDIERWEAWPAVGVEFLLAPLQLPDKRAVEAAARVTEKDDAGNVTRVYTDVARYAQGIGRRCVRNWRPMKGHSVALVDYATRQPLPYSRDAVDALMTIGPAADWVIQQVESLSLYVDQEISAAGNV